MRQVRCLTKFEISKWTWSLTLRHSSVFLIPTVTTILSSSTRLTNVTLTRASYGYSYSKSTNVYTTAFPTTSIYQTKRCDPWSVLQKNGELIANTFENTDDHDGSTRANSLFNLRSQYDHISEISLGNGYYHRARCLHIPAHHGPVSFK